MQVEVEALGKMKLETQNTDVLIGRRVRLQFHQSIDKHVSSFCIIDVHNARFLVFELPDIHAARAAAINDKTSHETKVNDGIHSLITERNSKRVPIEWEDHQLDHTPRIISLKLSLLQRMISRCL